MFDIVFTDREVGDYRSALGDEATMKRCNALLRERGILKSASKYYISTAHTDEDVRATLDAFASVPTRNWRPITHPASIFSRAARARLILARIAAPSAFQV